MSTAFFSSNAIANEIISALCISRNSVAQRWQLHLFARCERNLKKKIIFFPLWSEIENQQDATVRCLLSIIFQHVSGHHYAHLQENKTCVTACGVLRWFCWMWLVAVLGRCLVGCEHYQPQPQPAEPAQHTTCSNTLLVLLKMCIMMPRNMLRKCW